MDWKFGPSESWKKRSEAEYLEAWTNSGPWISGLTDMNMVNIAKGIDDCKNVDKKDFSFHLFFDYFQFNWCDTFL